MSTYTITTSQDNTGLAPEDHRWCACFGEPDYNTEFGFGDTEAEAVRDLLTNVCAPWEF